jgi:hypothetical protein
MSSSIYPVIPSSSRQHAMMRQVEELTNDSEEVNEVSGYLQTGYIYEYSCRRAAGNVPLAITQVSFDYEFVALKDASAMNEMINPDATIPTLPAIEWGLLWGTADAIGLHGCSNLDPTNRHLMSSTVIAISRMPSDALDQRVCKFLLMFCSNAVDAVTRFANVLVSAAGCEWILEDDLPDDQTCYPIRGTMTATYSGDNATQVEEYLLGIIREKLNDQQALTGGVTKTLYLGDRHAYASSAIAGSPDQGSSNSTSTPPRDVMALVLGLSVGVAFLLLMVAAVFIIERRPKIDRKEQMMDTEADEEKGSIQSDEFQSASSNFSSPARSMASKDTYKASNVSPPHDVDLLADTLMTSKTHPDTDSESGDASLTSGNSEEATASETEMAEITNANRSMPLPPLPPNGPSSKPPAIQRMTRRRRKKKRKKPKLTRTNSREGLKEMETIDEVAEVSDDDAGSEYSWSTDEESGRSSRDPSPCRSEGSGGEGNKDEPVGNTDEPVFLTPRSHSGMFV